MKNQLLHRRLSLSFLSLPMLVACSEPLTSPTQVESEPYLASTLPTDVGALFDDNRSPRNDFRVVGTLRPPAWSWGEIELLEGQQLLRTEGYNRRSDKLRAVDTFQSSKYPLGTYFGALNQQLVDGFNLFYKDSCATSARTRCTKEGPTRPAARFVLLHKGPKTAALSCDTTKTPMLLVHGAMQDANVWLFPSGNDGSGNAFPGTTQKTGMVQALEAANRCTYAVTFGNFHGDNYSQAIALTNAISRIRALHTRADGTAPKVDVLAWSKGVLAVDAYLANAKSWRSPSTRFFDRVADAQAAAVPAFRSDVRIYIALSGPHQGLDLNFRHPIHTLSIASTSSNAPIGRGPMPWSYFAAMQCVNWGPDSPWYDNPYAKSVCEGRGGSWLDFWNRIYLSNITGLNSDGKPQSSQSLKQLNGREGVSSSGFEFDEYNISLFGSVDESGKYLTGYLGQLQAANDLRSSYPVPRRDSSDWSTADADENRWYPWIRPKLSYLLGGYLDDTTRSACRKTGFDAAASPCIAWHSYLNSRNADSVGLYNKYQLMSGLGISAALEMGGHFIQRLMGTGLDSRLDALYVLYGEASGSPDSTFETDGMSCPTCAVNGDGVLFNKSIAAISQLTQGWSSSKRSTDAKQESVAYGHLEVGATPAVWSKVLRFVEARD